MIRFHRRHGAFPAVLIVSGAVFASLLSAPSAHADPLGVEAIDDPLPYFDDRQRYPVYDPSQPGNKRPDAITAVTSRGQRPIEDGLELLLTRTRYPAEDGHLDAVLWLDSDAPTPAGALRVELVNEQGDAVAEHAIDPIPGNQLFFSPPVPDALIGARGELVVTWEADGDERAQVRDAFYVDEPTDVERSGRIALRVPNDTGATLDSAPVTVGVPFPRGALGDERRVRLVDADGQEIPLQTEITGRWSRFGSIRWLLCHFNVDLDGEPRELHLEFGPEITRAKRDAPDIERRGQGFPQLTTERFHFDGDGLAAAPAGDGAFEPLLDAEGLLGAFVEHVHNRPYDRSRAMRRLVYGTPHVIPEDIAYEVESHGPVHTSVRQRGAFVHPATGDEFCKFDVRYLIHHDSSVVRVFFTWVYTGDSGQDRISNMGWRLPLADGLEPMGLLTSFEGGDWLEADSLLQHDHDKFDLLEGGNMAEQREGRAPGVFAAASDELRFYVGVKDFWQNFPGELEFRDGSMFVHTWPRHGKERRHVMRIEDGHRLWFAHEGQLLDFRLPIEMTEGDFYENHSRGEPHWEHGRPESVNAQGIAKTTEMWLYVTDERTPRDDAVRTLEGLNAGSLRAVVDPQWLAYSGAFYEIHHRDTERFEEHERIFEIQSLSPLRQVERMGVYGKWVYGELLRSADRDEQTVSTLYRLFRKGHWGWPYSWIPFARSGDLAFFKFAEAATRMMTDVAFVHYVSDDVADHMTSLPERRFWAPYQPFRDRGWHNRNLLPWAGYWGPSARLYADGGEYLWHAYHLTGYHRAKEVLEVWAELSKIEHPDRLGRQAITEAQNRGRWSIHLQKQYLEMYENTFDPWFIVAAHAIAEMHVHRYENDDWAGHPWNTGPHDFQRYTGDEDHLQFLLHSMEHITHWQNRGWANTSSTLIPSTVHGYRLTGDERYLRRAAGLLDLARISTYEDEPWYYRGSHARAGVNRDSLFTSWYHRWAPQLLRAVAEAGGEVDDPIYMSFTYPVRDDDVIAIKKREGQSVPLEVGGEYRITTADGQLVVEGDAGEAPAAQEAFGTGAGFEDEDDPDRVVLPESLPTGVYHVHLGSRRLTLPISPPDTPEVLVLDDRDVGRGRGTTQFWFMVPEGVDTFTLRFDNPSFFRQDTRRITVWNPDGEVAWDFHQLARDHDGEDIEATVSVPEAHAGELWRVTLPGNRSSVPFTLDADLPAVLTHEPNRWFDRHAY